MEQANCFSCYPLFSYLISSYMISTYYCHVLTCLIFSCHIHFAVASTGGGETNVNLAANKPSFQVNEGWGGNPNRAVDGNKNPIWGGATCTHTQNVDKAWWYVDLGKEYVVTSVSMTNRGDCCCKYIRYNKIIKCKYHFIVKTEICLGMFKGFRGFQ